MFRTWTNAPPSKLRLEVEPHVKFALYQALASPRLEIKLADAESLGGDVWKVRVGVANTGWLNTEVTAWAQKHKIVLPITVDIAGATPIEGGSRVKLGQLSGRAAFAVNGDAKSDGTPDRALHSWLVRGKRGDTVTITAAHQRAGTVTASVVLP